MRKGGVLLEELTNEGREANAAGAKKRRKDKGVEGYTCGRPKISFLWPKGHVIIYKHLEPRIALFDKS